MATSAGWSFVTQTTLSIIRFVRRGLAAEHEMRRTASAAICPSVWTKSSELIANADCNPDYGVPVHKWAVCCFPEIDE